MLMTHSVLVGAGKPSLDQTGFPMAQGQQILAHICRFADHLMFVSRRSQSVVATQAIRLNHRPWFNRLLNSSFQALSRCISYLLQANASGRFSIFLCRNGNPLAM